MDQLSAIIAQTRFGWGVTPGMLPSVAADPRGHVLAQLAAPPDMTERQGMPGSAAAFALTFEMARLRRSKDTAQQAKTVKERLNRAAADDIDARLQLAVTTDQPFVDRLAAFWSNHFCVSTRKSILQAVAGPYEREAIRPHVLGSFSDMLHAVVTHPAMLVFLDNNNSVGPNSPQGRKNELGLNENLAREIFELHTLGVDGGYTQDDVTEFARALTGWSYARPNGTENPDEGGFEFRARRHEPGSRTIMGKVYGEKGMAQGEAILDDLAAHPSTARFIARKLARHFVSDTPPDGLVRALEASFLQTGGDLAALAQTLATHDDAWTQERTRFLPPIDFVVAASRALGGDVDPKAMRFSTSRMGQKLWAPPSPEGYADDSASWLGPEALKLRLAFANSVSNRARTGNDIATLADHLFGAAISAETMQTIERAEEKRQGLTLLLMSPDMQRR